MWEEVCAVSLALFELGRRKALEHGLLLVDTKYEFGLSGSKLVLVDEIHTADSSRYWVESTYLSRVRTGKAPEMLDKEPVRQWLLSKNFNGSGEIPEFTNDYRVELAEHYISSFNRITGKEFIPCAGDVYGRIKEKLIILKHTDF